jgi:hypothetical protein
MLSDNVQYEVVFDYVGKKNLKWCWYEFSLGAYIRIYVKFKKAKRNVKTILKGQIHENIND